MTLKIENFFDHYKKKHLSPIKSENFSLKEYLEIKNPPLLDSKRLKEFQKLFNRAKEKIEFSIDERIVAWMEFKEPQFFLKNIPRIFRFEEDVLPFEYNKVRDKELENISIKKTKYNPPQFLESFIIEDVKWLRKLLKEIIFINEWKRYFCKELKSEIGKPLWKYFPDSKKL